MTEEWECGMISKKAWEWWCSLKEKMVYKIIQEAYENESKYKH